MTTPRSPGYPHPASRLARSQAGGVLGDMKTPPRPPVRAPRRARHWIAAPVIAAGIAPPAQARQAVEAPEAIVAMAAVAVGAAGADE